MRVLIDGHNALGAIDVRGRTHEERRHALLERVAGLVADATVFFDARRAPQGLFEREAKFGVLAIYCRDEHADEYILNAVRNAVVPGEILVVSNDREVVGKAKQNGARTSSVQEFFVRESRPESSPDAESSRGTAARRLNIKNDYKPSDFGLPDEVDLSDPDID